ncbi:MAG: hypothetical protein NVS4B6_25170 [Mycobacterium sp.]
MFGSLDPHNFITVDKPPVSQWVMGLSGQIVVSNDRGHGPGSGNRSHDDIAKWVVTTFPAVSVGDATVYNLLTPK